MKGIKLLSFFCISVVLLIIFLGITISISLERGMSHQSDMLVKQFTSNTEEMLDGHLSMLDVFMGLMHDTVRDASYSVIAYPSTTKNIEDFNIKPLQELLGTITSRNDIDFIHLYDKNGKTIVTYPQVQSELSVEQYVQTWPAGKKVLENIKAGKDGDKASVHGYSFHDNEFFRAFGLNRYDSERQGGISYTSIRVIRDFFDDPIGFCIAGKMLNQFNVPLERLHKMTNTKSVIYLGSTPIASWFTQSGNDASPEDLKFSDQAKKTVYASSGITREVVKLSGENHLTVSKAIKAINDDIIGIFTVAIPESHVTLAKRPIEEVSTNTKNHIQLSVVIFGFVTVVLVLILANVVSRKLVRPIRAIKEFSSRVGEGDLRETLEITSSGELGSMTRSFNEMMNILQQTVIGIRKIARTISDYAEGLLAETEELATGSKEQDLSARQVAQAVAEMAQNITDVSQNASAAAQASKDVSITAEKGKEKVMQTVSGMKNIAGTVDEMASIVTELRENSTEIVNIVSLIDDIAEQTNLLALNAAIEAARAGEQGRGFSIVADEVRKLAERTSTATKDIHSMVKKIQADTDRSVKSMDIGRSEVEKGMLLVDEARDAMESIVQFANKCLDMVHQIATSCEEQSSASDEISSSMEGIAGLTNVTMDSSGRIETSSKNLRTVSDELVRAASWFKVNNTESAKASMTTLTSQSHDKANSAVTD